MNESVKLAEAPKLLAFLSEQRAATLSLPIDQEGMLHIASLLYWHDPKTLAFYFVTNQKSEKCRLLKDGSIIRSACVVGTEKGVDFTLQMRGTTQIIKQPDKGVVKAYYDKRKNRDDDLDDPVEVMLEFKPSWARFNDYSQGYGFRKFIDLESASA